MYTVFLLIAVYLGGGPSNVYVEVIDTFSKPGRCEEVATKMMKNHEAPKYKFTCKPVQNWMA